MEKKVKKNHFVQCAFSKTIQQLTADKNGWSSMLQVTIRLPSFMFNNIFLSKWRKAKVSIKTVSNQ